MHTPMGYICQGRPLHESHSFFAARNTDATDVETLPTGVRLSDDVDEAEDEYSDPEEEREPVGAL